jgi:hypothetical protein
MHSIIFELSEIIVFSSTFVFSMRFILRKHLVPLQSWTLLNKKRFRAGFRR